jgi:hypothetical protein
MQMSSPTVSASSIGPIGIPNWSAASSMVSGAIPSSTQRIAVIRYGASTRLTRNPGALFTGNGSRSICRMNAAAGRSSAGDVSRPCTISTSIIFATGLKKWRLTRRVRSPRRNILERDRRRVGREDGRRFGFRLDCCEQAALRVDVRRSPR